MFDFSRSARVKTASNHMQEKLVALEALTTNVMVADSDLNIIYVNSSLMRFLKEAERDIQRDVPAFKLRP